MPLGIQSVASPLSNPNAASAIVTQCTKFAGTGGGAATDPGVVLADGFKTIFCEIVENNVSSAVVEIEGSFDNVNFYGAGSQIVDDTASPSRSVADISVTQNTRHVYQILDQYPYLRVNLNSGSGNITVKFYMLPV